MAFVLVPVAFYLAALTQHHALFLDSINPLVFVVNKNGIVDLQATLGPGIELETPFVVLVDGNSASAAEVFATALQENSWAKARLLVSLSSPSYFVVSAIMMKSMGLMLLLSRLSMKRSPPAP